MTHDIYVYIFLMSVMTILIRILPLTLIRGEIKNTFLRSFLHYVPYVTLAIMTVPGVIYSTQSPISGTLAFIFATALAFLGGSLFSVAAISCVTVFITEFFLF